MSEVRRGYKQTEVGVIPGNWNVTPLGRIVLSVEYLTNPLILDRRQLETLGVG